MSSLGEPCAPHTLTKYAVVCGEIQKSELEVYGRKIPLIHIQRKLLQKHEALMQLHTDTELDGMCRSELVSILNRAKVVFDANAEDHHLRELLQKLERTRTFAIWHNHSTLLGKGYVMITAKILYDTAVFKTQCEIGEPLTDNVQAIVEQPELHMLATAVEDQEALIED